MPQTRTGNAVETNSRDIAVAINRLADAVERQNDILVELARSVETTNHGQATRSHREIVHEVEVAR